MRSLYVRSFSLDRSIVDMVKWDAALCREILKESTLVQMWKSYISKCGNKCEHGFSQGLGWHIPNYHQRKVVCYNGLIKGFAANMTHFIDNKVTVILLCNLENIHRPDAIAKDIAELFIPDLAQEPLKSPLYNS